MKQRHITQVIVLTILSCLALFYVEQILELSYIMKTLAKILLFLIVPIVFIKVVLKERLFESLRLNQVDVKGLQYGVGLGLLSVIVILAAYVLLQDQINGETIILDLQNRLNITLETYIFVALYITFGNSLLRNFILEVLFF
ncbi:hypothetical protein [Piscibacillus salipiscarius]|uniref:hypothetical protein n=1 Tax=Piscibacillus salipiscarius TaxID=299480 RepID=UPI0006D18725|nr:hypothetical protein [Piscibacillus salipiscarius]